MDGEHAIVRESSARVGYKSTSVDGRNIDYYVSVVDSTAPLPAWTTGGGEVGKWSFTEGTEGTDSSGKGNPLSFVSGRYSMIDGKDGKALLLNGATGIPSFAATQRPVLRTDRSFSVAGWVRLDSGTESAALISQGGPGTSAFVVGYDSVSRKWNMLMYHSDTTTSAVTEIESSAVAQIGTWAHLTGVYDAVAKKIRLYVNGVQAAEADYTVTPWHADHLFWLGAASHGGYSFPWVKAGYDEIRAYDRALSPTEIQWMLNLTPPTNANLPSGQSASITYDVGNVDSFKISVRACINGATPITCSESPYYRITTDAPYLPTDTETGMADPTQPILSGMVNRPSGGPVTAKYYLYDGTGAPVGAAPLGMRSVNGGERASFQIPVDTVRPGSTYSWQMVACAAGTNTADEVCTSKTAPVGFTTPGTPPPDPAENTRTLTLGKDSFIIKTARTDPAACEGGPCPLADADTVRVGGTGAEKTAAVVGFRLDEMPDGAAITEGILKLGTPTCPAGTCPADAVITATQLRSPVTNETRGSDLEGDADPDSTPYSLPLNAPQADIGDDAFRWMMLTSNKDEIIAFAEATAAEQPSLALTYLPAGPPSKVLNLTAVGGDASAIGSWGLPESNGSIAMLEGYDVEVIDAGGVVSKTLKAEGPWTAVSGLANNVTYTLKVRARTAFGIGDWEATTFTTRPVPPPSPIGGGATCNPFLDTPPSAMTSAGAEESGSQVYIDRVKAYYQAQDAVLEGRADAIWDAPGVTSSTPSAAKLSLLNATLLDERERLARMEQRRVDSTVALDGVVVQAEASGAVRVTAGVKRTWNIQPSDPPGDPAVARSMSDVPGQVEPSEYTISVFVFDRCGNVTIIDVPYEGNEDTTDFSDPCGGGRTEGSTPGATNTESSISTGERSCSVSDPVMGLPSGRCRALGKSMFCEVIDNLGKKGWAFRSTMQSYWTDPEDDETTPWNALWRLSKIPGKNAFMQKSTIYPTNAKYGKNSDFAYAIDRSKDTKMGVTGGACFIAKAIKTQVGLSVDVSVSPLKLGSIGASLGLQADANETCSEYKATRVPAISKRTVEDERNLVKGVCLYNGVLGDNCDVVNYRQLMISELSFGFWVKEGSGKKKYSSPGIIRHEFECGVKRVIRYWPLNTTFEPRKCEGVSNLRGRAPLN